MVERGGAQLDEHLVRARDWIGRILVAQDLRATLLVDPDRFHVAFTAAIVRASRAVIPGFRCNNGGDDHSRRAAAGCSARSRRGRCRAGGAVCEHRASHPRAEARGLFGRLGFTTTHPEVSCHPETLLEGARSVVSAALCYYLPEPERPAGHGRLPRYAWHDGYAELREKLEALGRELGAPYRVLVDANQHVDREAAARSGVGFYGKNTMLITRRHGSWVVLGTLVTAAELEPTPRVAEGCGSCTRCIDACPTGALDEPGVLDATRCLSYWTQVPEPIPEAYRAPLGAQVYGCDICQDVCPWNRGVERRRAGLPADAAAHIDLVAWLDGDSRLDDEVLAAPLCAPQRSALAAAKRPRRPRQRRARETGTAPPEAVAALRAHAGGADPLLADHARWALARLEEGECS